MSKRLLALSTVAILIALGSGGARAQSFFEGRTIRLIVGFAPGGGFDTYARVLSRHMGRHIPGTPTIVVENMTGAGSLISANHLYRVAKPDGLTIGTSTARSSWARRSVSPASSSTRGSSS